MYTNLAISIYTGAGAVPWGTRGSPSEISGHLWPQKKFKIRPSLAKMFRKLALY